MIEPTRGLRKFTHGTLGGVALVVLVLICYASTLNFLYIWDDDAYLLDNITLLSFDGLSRIWTQIGSVPQYYPLTFTSFWLEVHTYGFNLTATHAINVALHAISVLTLWTILRKLSVPGAWVAAAVFAVHPINVESVAWISERKNTLSLAFGLGALWVYLRYAGLILPTAARATATAGADGVKGAAGGSASEQLAKAETKAKTVTVPVTAGTSSDGVASGNQTNDQPGDATAEKPAVEFELPDDPRRLYLIFLAMFACALLSKTTLAVLPAVILVILWWKRGRVGFADLRPLLLPFAMSLALGLLTSYVEHDPYIVGVSGPDWAIGDSPAVDLAGRAALAGQTTLFYTIKLLLPHPIAMTSTIAHLPEWAIPYFPGPLTFTYPKWVVLPGNVLHYIGLFVLVNAIVWPFIYRRRWGRGPLAAVLLFVGCLFPAIGFFRIYPQRFSWVADHFAYIASIAFIVGFVAWIARLLYRRDDRRSDVPAAVLAGVAIVALTTVSIIHMRAFANVDVLWDDTIAKNPRAWMALLNKGSLKIGSAEAAYAVVDQDRGKAEAAVERERLWQEGEALVRRGLELHPDAYEGYITLASLAASKNQTSLALMHANNAQVIIDRLGVKGQIAPLVISAQMHLRHGDPAKAAAILQGILDRDAKRLAVSAPGMVVDLHLQLAAVYKTMIAAAPPGDSNVQALKKRVLEQYLDATEVDSKSVGPHLELARLLSSLGRYDSAVDELKIVIELDPRNIDAKLGIVHIARLQGELLVANNQLIAILEQDPRYLPAYVELAGVLNDSGRRADGIARLQTALALDPDYEPAKALLARLQDEALGKKAATSPTSPLTSPGEPPPTSRGEQR